jgi:quinol monooxygenase YgiN
MVTVGSLVRVEVKPEKVEEVEAMLNAAVAQVRSEETTTAWFALRLGPTTFGVFDAFPDETGRDAHWAANGEALRARAADLFAAVPSIEHADVIAAKLP